MRLSNGLNNVCIFRTHLKTCNSFHCTVLLPRLPGIAVVKPSRKKKATTHRLHFLF